MVLQAFNFNFSQIFGHWSSPKIHRISMELLKYYFGYKLCNTSLSKNEFFLALMIRNSQMLLLIFYKAPRNKIFIQIEKNINIMNSGITNTGPTNVNLTQKLKLLCL